VADDPDVRRSKVNVLVHIVWATLGRRPVLLPWFDASLGAMLRNKALELGCAVVAVGNASDHVHALVRQAPGVNLSELIKRLKGASAHQTNLSLRLPHRLRWQSGYWAESVAPCDVDLLAAYLRKQREHHDDSHPAECWQMSDSPE
jgi:putative transposase